MKFKRTELKPKPKKKSTIIYFPSVKTNETTGRGSLIINEQPDNTLGCV